LWRTVAQLQEGVFSFRPFKSAASEPPSAMRAVEAEGYKGWDACVYRISVRGTAGAFCFGRVLHRACHGKL